MTLVDSWNRFFTGKKKMEMCHFRKTINFGMDTVTLLLYAVPMLIIFLKQHDFHEKL